MTLDQLRAVVERAINGRSAVSHFGEAGIRVTIRAIATTDTAAGPDTTVDIDGGPALSRTIHSSLFGLFHLQPDGDAAPFVRLGQIVEAGQRIGLIEAMKVFNPVVSHRSGRIVAVLAEHGAEVECGQPLFHVE